MLGGKNMKILDILKIAGSALNVAAAGTTLVLTSYDLHQKRTGAYHKRLAAEIVNYSDSKPKEEPAAEEAKETKKTK